MRSGCRASGWCFTVLSGALACSGRVDSPNDGQGAAGQTSALAGAGAGSTARAGSGGSSSGGAVGSTAGAGGLPGAGGGSAGGAALSGAGAASNEAEAQLAPIAGTTSGTARFQAAGDRVALIVTLTGCPEGPHALHLHANTSCADGGNAAGGHWSPQGELIPDVTCAADGTGQLSFSSPPGVWSLGAPAGSDVLRHALILHAGPTAPAPAARIACGIPVKVP